MLFSLSLLFLVCLAQGTVFPTETDDGWEVVSAYNKRCPNFTVDVCKNEKFGVDDG
jgi:hypothetical protein